MKFRKELKGNFSLYSTTLFHTIIPISYDKTRVAAWSFSDIDYQYGLNCYGEFIEQIFAFSRDRQ